MKNKKENYFVNDEGLCVAVLNGNEHDSVVDLIADSGYHLHYGVIKDDFNEDDIHKNHLEEK